MSALLWFLIWALFIFLMMRFGCGAHVMGHGHREPSDDPNRNLRWEPPETDSDPVCGKTVKTSDAKPSVFEGLVYYFCSRDCREAFEAAPHLYTQTSSPAAHGRLESQHG